MKMVVGRNMMKIVQAEYVASAVKPQQYPTDALPEIALAGRSNVGKSSLINRMVNRKNLARTSSRPGKTQTLNFYRVNGQLYFVDLPGYGYAQVSRSMRREWGAFIEQYLLGRQWLKLMLLLVDVRHPPTAGDCAMYEWVKHHGIPVCVVATKADKISRGQWQKHLRIAAQTLDLDPNDPLVLFSSETGAGREELWNRIAQAAGLSDGAPHASDDKKAAPHNSGNAAAGSPGSDQAAAKAAAGSTGSNDAAASSSRSDETTAGSSDKRAL